MMREALCICLLCLLPVVGLADTTGKDTSSTSKKTESKAPAPRNAKQEGTAIIKIQIEQISIEPIQITAIYVGPQRVKPRTPFPNYEQWLRDLSVEVKNTSDVSIKYIELALSFPAKQPDGKRWLGDLWMTYGWDYFRDRELKKGELDVIIPPGGSVRISFDLPTHQRQLNSLMRIIRDVPASALSELIISLYVVVYEDLDSAWYKGWYFKRVEGKWMQDDKKIGLHRRLTRPDKFTKTVNSSLLNRGSHRASFLPTVGSPAQREN
jgi:hypothetical protein